MRWESWGWKDVQQLAYERWSIEPTVTCKHKSRKDSLFLSPMLQKYVTAISNTWDQFSDHSILSAVMQFPSGPLKIAKWFKPSRIQYKDKAEIATIRNAEHVPVPHIDDASDQYEAVCAAFEKVVDSTKKANGQPGLLSSQKGGGKTRERHFVTHRVSPLKPSRSGELEPIFSGLKLRHKRWFTQYRRLIAYMTTMSSMIGQRSQHMNTNSKFGEPSCMRQVSLLWPHRATADAFGPLFIPTHPPALPLR